MKSHISWLLKWKEQLLLVAEQEKIDWLILRVISDSADDSAKEDFSSFIMNIKFSLNLIKFAYQTFNYLNDFRLVKIKK